MSSAGPGPGGWRRAIPRLTSHESRLLWLLGCAALFNRYDEGLHSLLLVQIQADLQIPEAELGLLGSAIRLGALPAFLVMVVADRAGRRAVLLWTIALYTAFTAATAFAPSYEAFVALQVCARMFITAEFLLGAVVLIEEFRAEHRGWAIGVMGLLSGLGYGLSMGLFGLVEVFPLGWRGLFLVGVGPLLLIAHFRRGLPETQRFERVRGRLETAPAPRAWLEPVRLLARRYPGRFAAVCCVGFLGSFSNGSVDFFLPKYLQEMQGWSPGELAGVLVAAGAVGLTGQVFVGRLSDRFGRKRLGVPFLALEPLCAILMYAVIGPLAVPLVGAWIFSSVAVDVVRRAYTPELFPTSHRSTAVGAAALVQTAGSVLGLASEGLLYAWLGSHWAAVRAIAATGLAMPLVVAIVYPETSGRALEEIAPEEEPAGEPRPAPGCPTPRPAEDNA